MQKHRSTFSLVKSNPLKTALQKISYIYLLAVPLLATALAFIVGHVSFYFYIPFWLLNTLLMILATRQLVQDHQQLLKGILCYFITPWMLIAIFGGMGPAVNLAYKADCNKAS